ncbi:DNA polymerase beta domain protein region [Acidianus hospitalis W1]|uniref:DNA polymerase beta domain protein region n=1 Tax=Acidianus hospitalis (strain W1) TaxID=933801 RepID=F4B8L4_ACIHW|nr:nucleotidyltransferase domain-containing protein [Acidianus hospitalis]AEE94966.1 DNA polymerase beta domain protein region [Acidianus hospitalis W1]
MEQPIELLRNWRKLISNLSLDEYSEVYVFGSVVEGKITGYSDIDVLVIIPNKKDKLQYLLKFYDEVEKKLGEKISYLFDVKVIYPEEKSVPPYSWFLKKSIKIK